MNQELYKGGGILKAAKSPPKHQGPSKNHTKMYSVRMIPTSRTTRCWKTSNKVYPKERSTGNANSKRTAKEVLDFTRPNSTFLARAPSFFPL